MRCDAIRIRSASELETEIGGTLENVAGRGEIESILARSGSGSRGIVVGITEKGGANAWNAGNFGGSIEFIDGQLLGRGLSNFDKYVYFMFMLIP